MNESRLRSMLHALAAELPEVTYAEIWVPSQNLTTGTTNIMLEKCMVMGEETFAGSVAASQLSDFRETLALGDDAVGRVMKSGLTEWIGDLRVVSHAVFARSSRAVAIGFCSAVCVSIGIPSQMNSLCSVTYQPPSSSPVVLLFSSRSLMRQQYSLDCNRRLLSASTLTLSPLVAPSAYPLQSMTFTPTPTHTATPPMMMSLPPLRQPMPMMFLPPIHNQSRTNNSRIPTPPLP
eukprot:CAMPEP_0184650632 /NCGR_PEP_ID=MMETSP0308-20130426/8202_1 /TAXON_ID=38269 /ORGANISM="Gloeochaete witrockiana, Strain SAG 46.84" /LENGTH=233 /DNA_ID=CAMNT_0027084319 /DNA_START=192 /DNA_END=890 /DNA_ORIENTATION=-